MDMQYFEDLWSEGRPSEVPAEGYWNNRADDFSKSAHSNSTRERVDKILAFLLETNMLSKDSDVLDIGCGPGYFSREFAKKANLAIGIDLSDRMLEHAAKGAIAYNLQNLQFKKSDWENVILAEENWYKKFDLVTAINCPGIRNLDTLQKMIDASRKYCFLTSFASRTDSVKDCITNQVLRQKGHSFTGIGVYSIINILWLMGYYPNVTYVDSEWIRTRTEEEAFNYYCSCIRTHAPLTEEQNKSIKAYLKEISEAGMVEEIIRSKTAWIYWHV